PVSEVKTTTAPAEIAAEDSFSEQVSSEEDFGSILEKFEQDQVVVHPGEVVTGKVIGVSEHGVVVDFGYKAEGVAPLEEFTAPNGEVTVKTGDEVEVVIRNLPSGDGPPVLSFNDAQRRKTWEEIEKAFRDGTPVSGVVVDKTKGGLNVDISGIEAFMPGSLVDSRPVSNLDSYKGQEIEAVVIKFSRKKNNIVLSRKAITDEVIGKQKAETLEKLETGFVVEGVIKNLTDYGAFVDIGGIDGLLHVTDMSWGRLQNPSDMFKVADTIQVKVLKLDRVKEKVSLGFKQLQPDPWSAVVELYPVGARIKGKISSVTEYGAFVELEPGVEGLVHVSEMSWSKRARSPKTFLKSGDEVEVQVLGVDTEDRRISLGMRQLQPNPWEHAAALYRVGTTVTGSVRNLTDFGAFIELEEGIDGLVHISDISRSKKIKHPKEVLKKGQEVQAVVTSLDVDAQKMSLSIKELVPSVWDSFITAHRPGDVVRGKISRFAGFGIFVELEEDLEGLCHISELSDERIDNPEKIFSIGQELDFKILRIETDNHKIGLSHRAVGKEDEPIVDYKSYTTEAKGGMASLGELANLKFSSSKSEEAKTEAAEPAASKAKEVEEVAEVEEAASSEEVAEVEEAASSEEVAAVEEVAVVEEVADVEEVAVVEEVAEVEEVAAVEEVAEAVDSSEVSDKIDSAEPTDAPDVLEAAEQGVEVKGGEADAEAAS
ncbi:MAG TPA: 30S ribosomal protein S1, partial [Pyrinomonadaceae bacterium]|nr:30S ribosomal protein S1 [Pyrinomonadaceae bacterium]